METDATNPEAADTGLDVNEIDTEPEVPEVESEVAETATPGVGDFWKVAEEAFSGETPDADTPISEWRADDIKALPGQARQALRDALALRMRDAAEWQKKIDEKDAYVKAENEKLEQARLALARDREQFAALANDPEVKKVLEQPVEELPDAMTPEGIEARIQREAARLISKRFEPITQAAQRTELERRYLEFVDKNPEMKDPAFKAEVDAELEAHNKNGVVVLRTPQAYEIIKGRRLAKAEEARRAQDAAARRESARHVAARTVAGGPTNEIPAHIRRDPKALLAFLEANPSVVQATLGRR